MLTFTELATIIDADIAFVLTICTMHAQSQAPPILLQSQLRHEEFGRLEADKV